MLKPLVILAICLSTAGYSKAVTFDDHFEDRTLRLDYIMAGDSADQQIFFEQAYAIPRWAGRKSRLTEMPLLGNGQVKIKAHDTGELLYVHTFSTLFQEWQGTEEAPRVRKAFETSYNVPFPKHPVDVTVTLTDFHNKEVGKLTHTII